MSIYGRPLKKFEDRRSNPGESVDVDLSAYVKKTGARMTGRLNMGSKKITDVGDPENPQDAVTKAWADRLHIYINDIHPQ